MKNAKFIEKYKGLPRVSKIKSKKRDQIIKECEITRSIFYNWLSGITIIDERSRPIVAKILELKESELIPNYKKKIN